MEEIVVTSGWHEMESTVMQRVLTIRVSHINKHNLSIFISNNIITNTVIVIRKYFPFFHIFSSKSVLRIISFVRVTVVSQS